MSLFLQIPMTAWGPTARDVVRLPSGNVVEFKGIIVDNREGRACLKTNSRCGNLIGLFWHYNNCWSCYLLWVIIFVKINSKSVAAVELKTWSDEQKKIHQDAKAKTDNDSTADWKKLPCL